MKTTTKIRGGSSSGLDSGSFFRSARSLHADGFRWSIVVICLAAVLLGTWGAWFTFSRVSVYEKTDMARFAVTRLPHPVEALIYGREAKAKTSGGGKRGTGCNIARFNLLLGNALSAFAAYLRFPALPLNRKAELIP